MASAARIAVAQVREIADLGQLDPESIVTPGIFVKRVVKIGATLAKEQA
jgi:3-oxoadipate CoA-transferase alpha subunit